MFLKEILCAVNKFNMFSKKSRC